MLQWRDNNITSKMTIRQLRTEEMAKVRHDHWVYWNVSAIVLE